jgi:hypothetical protein
VPAHHRQRHVDVVRTGQVTRRPDERVVVEDVEDSGDWDEDVVLGDLRLFVAFAPRRAATAAALAGAAVAAAPAVAASTVVIVVAAVLLVSAGLAVVVALLVVVAVADVATLPVVATLAVVATLPIIATLVLVPADLPVVATLPIIATLVLVPADLAIVATLPVAVATPVAVGARAVTVLLVATGAALLTGTSLTHATRPLAGGLIANRLISTQPGFCGGGLGTLYVLRGGQDSRPLLALGGSR